MSKNKCLKVDFTAEGGFDDESYKLIQEFCSSYNPVLLCMEGDGLDTHKHAHAVISTSSRPDNFKRKIKKLYEDNGLRWNKFTVLCKQVVNLEGALSYVYKEKRILICLGYDPKLIKDWKVPVKVNTGLKTFVLNQGNAVDKIIVFADSMGIKVNDLATFKQVLKSMALSKFRLSLILKNIRPIMIDVLANYGDVSHLDSFLDEKCNMFV